MIATIFIVVIAVYLAALGRSASPRAERVPWTTWSTAALIRNVIQGARRFADLQKRNSMTPHRAPPLDQH